MPSDVLAVPALPRTPKPRTDLLLPLSVLERRDSFGGVEQRGVIGSLDIAGTETGHVLRHAEVGEEAVRFHARRLREHGDGGEPLLFAAPELGRFRECIADAVGGSPDAVLDTSDGGQLRLWDCRDAWRDAPPALGPVLLADGHHRLEAARRLRLTRPEGGSGRVPALVVDHTRHPLRVSATHRVVPGLDLNRAVRAAARFARVRRHPAGLCRRPSRGRFLLAGAGECWEVSAISMALMANRLRRLPSEWVELDAAVSDHVLLPLLCEDQGLPPVPRYTERPEPGEVALLLPPPTWNQIWAGAASGTRMPCHAASLGPKPPRGLLDLLR